MVVVVGMKMEGRSRKGDGEMAEDAGKDQYLAGSLSERSSQRLVLK